MSYMPHSAMDWPARHPPTDEPRCGYDGSKCPGTKARTKFAAGVLGGLLILALIITILVYRRWKMEQEVQGLLWKINVEALQV